MMKCNVRNRAFIVILVVACLVITATSYRASKQNERFTTTQTEFFQGVNLLQKGSPAQAEPLLAKAVSNYPDSYYAAWMYGLSLAGNNKYQEAQAQMQQAETIRPALLIDQTFLLHHGEILFQCGRYNDAKLYVQQSLNVATKQDLADTANKLMVQIDTKISESGNR